MLVGNHQFSYLSFQFIQTYYYIYINIRNLDQYRTLSVALHLCSIYDKPESLKVYEIEGNDYRDYLDS